MGLPETMKAVVIDGHGDPDVLRAAELPVPEVGAGEVLIEVAAAGVGVWDAGERSGAMAAMLPPEAGRFPRVIGGDGSGRVAAVGDGVTGLSVGDEVYGYAFGSAKGGFYAEYVAVTASQVAKLPDGVDLLHGAALAVPSATALRGLTEALDLKSGQSLAVFGAAGSVGLPAVQLAKLMGAKVLAIASGADGVALAKQAGADTVVDGKGGDVAGEVARFAPDGLDAVLATANGDGLGDLATALRSGGRLAFPHGVQPEPTVPDGRELKPYDGNIDSALLKQLNGLISGKPYVITISEQFPLDRAADAHRLLQEHRPGRPVLKVRV